MSSHAQSQSGDGGGNLEQRPHVGWQYGRERANLVARNQKATFIATVRALKLGGDFAASSMRRSKGDLTSRNRMRNTRTMPARVAEGLPEIPPAAEGVYSIAGL